MQSDEILNLIFPHSFQKKFKLKNFTHPNGVRVQRSVKCGAATLATDIADVGVVCGTAMIRK